MEGQAWRLYFWYEKWTSLGALYHWLPEVSEEEEIEIKQFAEEGRWRPDLLTQYLPEEIVQHITTTINLPQNVEEHDSPIWMLEQNGKFSVKSAWQYIRHKEEKEEVFTNIWINKLPFKMAFTLWAWKFRLPVGEMVQRMGISLPSRCHCCQNPKRETVSYFSNISHS